MPDSRHPSHAGHAPTPRSPRANPGSHDARCHGCTCPVIDNAYGRGRDSNLVERLWIVDASCPYHVCPAPAAQPGEQPDALAGEA